MMKMTRHLDDEHMQLYEWSGAGTAMAVGLPHRSKRTHPWHASYAVLALLTSLLTLAGCESKGPAEQAGEQVDQAAQDMKERADASKAGVAASPGPAENAGRAIDQAREQAGEKVEPAGEDLQKK